MGRLSTVQGNDLARAIGVVAEEIEKASENSAEFQLYVEGASRGLAPLVREEAYRIVSEAVRNAFRHSQAARIEVQIRYAQRQLQLKIRDNGKDLDPAILAAGGRAGHHGLPGMQERANIAGAKLAIWSQSDSGTEIELTVPAAVAYAKAQESKGHAST